MNAAEMLRAEIAKRKETAARPVPLTGVDAALVSAFERRFADSDARKARATGQEPQESEDEYTRAKRILFPEKPIDPEPAPLNGRRVTDALAAALRGPGSTVRTPDNS